MKFRKIISQSLFMTRSRDNITFLMLSSSETNSFWHFNNYQLDKLQVLVIQTQIFNLFWIFQYFMDILNFSLCRAEHEKSFITMRLVSK